MAERSHRFLSRQFGRSVWAAGVHTEQEEEEEEEVEVGGGTAGEQVSLGALDVSESSQTGYSHKKKRHLSTLSGILSGYS